MVTNVELSASPPLHGSVAARTSDGEGLHSQVLDEIGQAICEGRMPAGMTIRSEELENRYQVSRSVIRESLRALEAMGMIASKRRVGIRILPISEWNVYDLSVIRWRLAGHGRIAQLRSLTQLRSAIEPEAAKLAASRGALGEASDLMGLAGRLWAAGRSGNEREFLTLDVEFHSLILHMSGNEMFARLSNLVSEVLIGRTHYGLMPKYPHDEALQLHVNVANAIQSGNTEMAGQSMLRIMSRTIDEMGELWDMDLIADSAVEPHEGTAMHEH
ncbi:FadR/GntR family transcriptional regulator [Microterricola viridarii]|uniref:DNA-binding transcriptional regulator, FadR family n=1 Tax=Microterricola viridarii TaxID=412690 RepID=A0A1H1XTD3_9MICO|nr:FCD domain-containing protein [Microterricola viridarii]SDT12470.1 DNA-binding transcriptional regulator, FadR family [Microterricola viridarii]